MKSLKKLSVLTENQEQRLLVKWLINHPQLSDFFCKINNEGRRTAAQTWNLKLLGLRPGVSDLFIPYPSQSRKFAGLWLEVKRDMKYPLSAQKSESWRQQIIWIERMKNIGFHAEMCYGWLNGKEIIERYLLS